MIKTDRKNIQAVLTAKYEELCRTVTRRDGIAIERSADALDETQRAAERELSTRGLEREAKLLRTVRLALDRVGDGTYGACLECEEEISQKRLQALPWAALCIRCQEQADRNLHSHIASRGAFLMAA
jgi:RNA polymerase-binding transcription factor